MTGQSKAKLLWTGGWDSTFRLLNLVLVRGRQVEPYYILDRKRRSIRTEIATMDVIKNAIASRSTVARALIEETRIVEKESIPPDAMVTAAYERIKERSHFGSQYGWLARFVRANRVHGAELCWQQGGRGYEILSESLVPDGDAWVLSDKPSSPDFEIFRQFRFPVILLSKRDMMKSAEEAGFIDIMYMTHFCFRPDRQGRPCGYCNPCNFVVEEGMGHRIPWVGYLRRYSIGPVWRAASKARSLVRRRLRS